MICAAADHKWRDASEHRRAAKIHATAIAARFSDQPTGDEQ